MDLCHICDSSTQALEQHLWEPSTGRQYAKLILMKMARYLKDFWGGCGELRRAACHEVIKGEEWQWASTNEFNMWLMPSGLFGSLPQLTGLWTSALSAVFFLFFFIFGLQNQTWSSAIREGLANVDECYPFKEDIMFATAISTLGLSLKFIWWSFVFDKSGSN